MLTSAGIEQSEDMKRFLWYACRLFSGDKWTLTRGFVPGTTTLLPLHQISLPSRCVDIKRASIIAS